MLPFNQTYTKRSFFYLNILLRLHLFPLCSCDDLSPALVVGLSAGASSCIPALVAGRWKLFGLCSVDQRLLEDTGVDVFGLSDRCRERGAGVLGLSGEFVVSGEKCIVWRDLTVSGEKEDKPAAV
jgi:hypothetical protein